jgi:hypothetical protein
MRTGNKTYLIESERKIMASLGRFARYKAADPEHTRGRDIFGAKISSASEASVFSAEGGEGLGTSVCSVWRARPTPEIRGAVPEPAKRGGYLPS